jgi:hypothetical protein
MSTRRVRNPAPGESLVNIDPALLQQVSGGWQHRMSLYTGRALTDSALTAEQQYRSGRLATLAQLVTPGISAGLNASVDPAGNVRVGAGYGFTALGEDVTLLRELNVTIGQLPVVNAITGDYAVTTDGKQIKTLTDVNNAASVKGGIYVLLLLPVTGKATGEEIDKNKGPNEISGMLDSSCTRDPEDYAFEDWETVDGTQLAVASWPDLPSLKLPDAKPDATWRNRISYTIFNAEMQLGPDGYLPWQGLGVALGLLNLDPALKVLFFDRNAVARTGGRARESQVLAQGDQYVQASRTMAEARLLQLMEQNAQMASQADFTAYLNLPPTAILPVASLDLVKRQNKWFPKTWKLHVAPIHAEEVETALREQMFAKPFDLTQAEEADVLLPLTDDVYDPQVLNVDEKPDPVFQDELNKATDARNKAVQHRVFLQKEANGLLKAQAKTPIDTNAGLTQDELTAAKTLYTPPADGSEAYGTVPVGDAFQSADVKKLVDTAGAAPYTVQVNGKPLALFTKDDLGTLTEQGVQAFIDRINDRINKIDDLLNINFLQTQTNIYRYRTNVLQASDAARLVTSPIIANIAQRESAVATAQDLSAYLKSITPPPATRAATPTPPSEPTPPSGTSSGIRGGPMLNMRTGGNVNVLKNLTGAVSTRPIAVSGGSVAGKAGVKTVGSVEGTSTVPLHLATSTLLHITQVEATSSAISDLPSKSDLPTETDVSSQLPFSGVPFNLRTLSIAERLKTAPSHEALLYTLSTRTSFLDTVLADDFGISVDDLEILVMEQDDKDKTKFNPVVYSLSQLRDANTRAKVYGNIQNAGLLPNADESGVFSAGITVLDHHTLLLRAVEARIALYRQFLALASKALTSIQNFATQVFAALKQAENQLAQARANIILVTGLFNDETARIKAVTDRRKAILANVPFVVLMRRRTLQAEANVPSRQLVPANVESPVPAALQSTAIVPPELRELASLLREAPLAWFPAIDGLLSRLEHPRYFMDIAQHMQVRAYTRLQLPAATSSATSHPGPYGAPIAEVFSSQQTALGNIMQQRANYNSAPLQEMNWAAQKTEIFRVAAINDVLAAETVHLEVSRELASLVENVSKIATALYLRMSATLPADRLQWAEYLRAGGRRVAMRYLTVLPGWQNQEYVERQQMQMLVDWLFGQIDSGLSDAAAYMSDLVRTAVLLASHAPVNDIIAGEVAVRTKPVAGGLVPITSDSSRISRGMTVMLYQGSSLLARGVVDDLDPQQSYARISDVYQEDTYLETSAQAHFLNDRPENMLMTNVSLAKR